MKLNRRLGLLAFLSTALLVGAYFSILPATVLAQVDTAGLETVGAVTQLSATDPRVIAARIINIALGLLGIITLTIVLYAGFTWMTAGGDAEKVEKAKKLLRNAVIGLIIILSSWALTTYIISRLLAATSGSGGSSGSGPGGPGGGGFGGGPSSGFQIESISPVGTTTIRNIQVRFLFSRDVSPSSAATQITVVRVSDNAPVAGTSTVFGSVVTFTPSAACPAPNADRNCFDANTLYEAQVGGSLQSADRRTISCGGFAPPCRSRFTSGSIVDTASPSVRILTPFDGQSVNASSTERIMTRAADDSGISYIETSVDGRTIGRASPTATSTPTAYDGSLVWDPAGLSIGSHALQSRAFDIDSNNGSSPVVNVALRAGHCFNAVRDADETALDCGGRDCGACSGGACTRGTDCRSGVCSGGVCVEQPIITGMTPGNGRVGTFVTISGVNFGRAGTVRFWNGTAFAVLASAPVACTGVVSWSPTQVLIAVPDAARTGPIQLTNASSSLLDATNDANGPVLGDYAVNDLARPGLCAILPQASVADVEASLRGVGFGASQGATDRVFFNDGTNREITSYGAWSEREVRIITPRIPPAAYAVHVSAGGVDSNTIDFTLTAPVVTTPIVDSLDPTATTVGSYVTISGRNFGDRAGVVRFTALEGGGGVGFGEIPTVAQCAASWWRDTSIIVKVPSLIGTAPLTRPAAPGRYEISIVRPEAGQLPSNALPFSIRAGVAGPGICAIEPIAGPAGVSTTVYGERFGSAPDRVTFDGPLGRLPSNVASWTSNRIELTVPSTARTGPVKVSLGAENSNGVNFQVRSCLENPIQICGASRQCCANGTCAAPGDRCAEAPRSAQYAWQTSTGEIPISPRVVEDCDQTSPSPAPPSPSPWANRPDGLNVCLNAAVSVRFTTRLDPASIAGNFQIRKCTGTGSDPCASGAPIDVPGSAILRNVSVNSDYLYFRPPAGRWDPTATYAVTLRVGIRSLGARIEMEENPACGAGASYCFRFATGGVDARCAVSRVSVTPNTFTANEVGQQISYNSVPLTGSCLVLDDSINWRWYTGRGTAPGEEDGRASITNDEMLGIVSSTQVATALQETGARAIPIHAATNVPGQSTVVGNANLFVTFIAPTVTEFAPNCNQACVNASLWARFNVSMDAARATSRQIILRRCENESCTAYDPPTPLALCDSGIRLATSTLPSGLDIYNFLEINPMDPARGCAASQLQAGSYYRVTLRNGTDGWFSRSGLPLDVSRAAAHASPEGFTWTFRVKTENGGLCTANRVDITPLEKYETLVGARQLFAAQPSSAPDACSATGQRLIPTEAFSWRVLDPTVATLLPGNHGGLVDTTPDLPAGCSNRCLSTGSQGQSGRIASCGNDVVETTDAQYCRRPDGSACRVGDTDCRLKAPYNTPTNGACVLMPAGSRGSEECDLGPGNRNGAPGAVCSASCLWTGNTGPQCSNGVLDRGEQCDSKERICGVGANQGLVCSSDADCGGGRCNELRDRPGCSAGCFLEGSAVGSVCGEGTTGYGEACDDSNTVAGDGCSNVCLHEGSTRVTSVCGNGVVEAGETCERAGAIWPARCDQRTCLNQGTDICPLTPGAVNCCGNRSVESGEECDGTPGCSNRCLNAGSSAGYPTPSFCGDGLPLGIGEQCEAASSGDGQVDGVQLAQAVGLGTVGSDLRMSTQINSTYQTVSGAATYGVQCGRTVESECNPGGGVANGLTDQGCCMRRPIVTTARYPAPDELNVCRNTFVFAEFDQVVNESSVTNNFILAEENPGTSCATGTQRLDALPRASRTLRDFFASIWQRIVGFFGGNGVQAQVWCVGRVAGAVQFETVRRGSATTTRMSFSVSEALRPNTRYQVLFRGDVDLSDAIRRGVRNTLGTVMAGDSLWTFTTGDRICAANQVQIKDANEERPFLFQAANEEHRYSAQIQSVQGGRVVPIVPVPQYHWSWNPWRSQIPTVLDTVGASLVDPLSRASTSTIRADNRNGSALIFAGITIDRDTVNVPSASGTSVGASQLSTVILCQRPWPLDAPLYRGSTPPATRFEDKAGSSVLQGTSFGTGPFYNFSTLYCLDGRSTATSTDDLPPMVVHAVTSTAREFERGILRQYFFDYPTATDPRLRTDGIGIRILANPLHLSPLAWYQAQGFQGEPTPVTVDGYEGIQEGTTIYVAAVNTASNPFVGAVSSTIYLISYNADAQPLTQTLFRQLVDNWTFNINLTVNSDNSCKLPDGTNLLVGGRFVECTADWECAINPSVNATCASTKSKIQRDTVRVAHFQDLLGRLEDVKRRTSTYPTIASGSFIQSMSNSRWPSWQSALGSELGGSIPEDPINRFLTCGRCRGATGTLGKACVDTSECATGESCASDVGTDPQFNGFEPSTCWSAARQRFLCPQLDRPPVPSSAVSPSRVYQYRSIDRGARYELSAELEGPSASLYAPALPQEIKQCSGTGPTRLCSTDADCPIPGGFATCVGTGGRWVYRDMCSTVEYGSDNVCGNRVLGPTEFCEFGDTHAESCTAADGRRGTKIQSCSDCRAFVDTAATVCNADQTCGNGVRERYKCYGGAGFKYGQTCRTLTAPGVSSECSDPRDPSGITMICDSVNSHGGVEEACDDGALNGTYGRCNRTCTSIGATCGDNQISLGESCDNGAANGEYCDTASACVLADSCSADCRTRAPYCGDRLVQAGSGEQCDGASPERTAGAICSGGANAEQSCRTDADCPGAGARCGVAPVLWDTPRYAACPIIRHCTNDPARLCATSSDCTSPGLCADYQTQHTRTCGAPDASFNQCRWRPWSVCQPINFCGDGTVDSGEECDDGNRSDSDSCTSACRRNICGDRFMNVGVEQCDYGVDNGAACAADYGSTCARCSNTCRQEAQSGGYCGDGVRNGSEQCDNTDVPTASCRALGFDFVRDIRCVHPLFFVAKEDISSGGGVIDYPRGTVACTGARCSDPDDFFLPNSRLFDVYDAVTVVTPTSPAINPAHAAVCTGPRTDALTCSNTCGYSGCGRCSETPPPGESVSISGTVFDAVYSTEPVPNARVTLYYQGIRITETFTNDNGAFTLSGINQRLECGGYRIIVDSYRDNPCTPLTAAAPGRPSCGGSPVYGIGENEARYGGYWPFESRTFSASTFRVQGLRNEEGRIYIIPRVGPNETLVVANWNGPYSYFDAHLLLPAGYGNPTNGGSRDVRWGGQGNPNVATADPHANLFCFHADDPTTLDDPATPAVENNEATNLDCGSFTLAPETIKYKRGAWAARGYYSFMLWDYFPAPPNDINVSIAHFTDRSVGARIVTQDQYYSLDVPATGAACNYAGGWLVFQQDASTGNIVIPQTAGVDAGKYVCDSSNVPFETPNHVQDLFNGL